MIRRATQNDASEIAVVHVAAWRRAYGGIVPRTYLESLSIEKRKEMWMRQLDNPCNHIWVSTKDDCVNGFIAAGACRDDDLSRCQEIYAIYVSPNSQRQGLGHSLTEVFLSERCDPCVLWVFERNQNAINFYRSIGFEADGCTKIIELGGESLSEARYSNHSNHSEQGVDLNT